MGRFARVWLPLTFLALLRRQIFFEKIPRTDVANARGWALRM
jgi:hypothetical protein